MPVFLSHRDKESRERMDDPDCDPEELRNTYRQFRVVNSLITRWRKIYTQKLRPLLSGSDRHYSILDIGFGGGDIPLRLAQWAKNDGIGIHITGIETDKRACDYVSSLEVPENVTFLHASSTDLIESGNRYDLVVSNHLLHHLDEKTLQVMLGEARQLCKKAAFFNDIERSDIAYLLFNLLARPAFRSSFITGDGLTSIRRSYTLNELRQSVPPGWRAERIFPYRLLLSYHHE